MEAEPIVYVCEGKETIESVGSFWRLMRKAPECREFYFAGQPVVCVFLPLYRKQCKAVPGEMGKSQRRGHVLHRLLNRYYVRQVQGRLWDILLACQNTSRYPAFCSEAVFQSFCGEETLQRELWLTTAYPPAIMIQSLAVFLKKQCVFRRQTRLLVVCDPEPSLQELLFPYCGSLNYLQLLVQDKRQCEPFVQEVYEEYGLAVSVTERKECAADADILIDLSPLQTFEADEIKEGCLLFDGYSHSRLKEQMQKRKGVFYFSPKDYWENAWAEYRKNTGNI